jgi:hypothetical protein
VRTCDGYFFPISYATTPAKFKDDEKVCQRMCPASEVVLYSHRNPGEEVAQATSLSGSLYSQLPTAFRYRQEHNPSCVCKQPGQSWVDAVQQDDTVERGDIVVTTERSKQMAAPPKAPQTKANVKKKGDEQAAQPQREARPATPPAATEAEHGKKTIRSVGPTFIPVK